MSIESSWVKAAELFLCLSAKPPQNRKLVFMSCVNNLKMFSLFWESHEILTKYMLTLKT